MGGLLSMGFVSKSHFINRIHEYLYKTGPGEGMVQGCGKPSPDWVDISHGM
jgi:hypothetical protein